MFWLFDVSKMLHKISGSETGLVTQVVKKIVWEDF